MKNQLMTAVMTFTALAGVLSCDKENNNKGNQSASSAVLKSSVGMDLSTVQAFLIAPTSSDKALMLGNSPDSAEKPSKEEIYAIAADGSLAVLQVYESSPGGAASSTALFNPQSINNTAKYTIFTYEGVRSPEGKECRSVALRKGDGSLFCIATAPASSPDFNGAVTADASGDLVYINSNAEGLWLLDFTSSEPSLIRKVDPDLDGYVQSFAVNKDGDVLLSVATKDGSKSVKIYYAGDGFQNIFASEGDCLTSGVGDDSNNFYYVRGLSADTSTNIVLKLTKIGSKFTETTLYDDVSGSVGIKGCAGGGTVVKTKSKIYSLAGNISSSGATYFVELVNGGTPIKRIVDGFEKIERLAGFADGLIIQGVDLKGNGGLKRFKMEGNSFSEILKPGDYTISKISASHDGAATFSGRRASDNGRVVGNITSDDSDVKIILQSLKSDIQFLERLN